MSSRGDLTTVLERGTAMDLIAEHARVRRCRVAVFGQDGLALRAEGDLASARPSGTNGHVRVDGVPPPVAAAPVVAFDRVLGYVVVRGGTPDRRPGVPQAVADHGAAVLGELCAREYELNDLSR